MFFRNLLGTFAAKIPSKTYHPRVEECLSKLKSPDAIKAALEKSYEKGHDAMKGFMDEHASILEIYKKPRLMKHFLCFFFICLAPLGCLIPATSRTW